MQLLVIIGGVAGWLLVSMFYGVAGWLLVSMFYGKLMPVLSLPVTIAVFIGGVVGAVVLAALAGSNKKTTREEFNNLWKR